MDIPASSSSSVASASSFSLSYTRSRSASPPPKSSLNTFLNCSLISANCLSNCFFMPVSSSSMIPDSEASDAIRSSYWVFIKPYLSDTSLYSSIACTFTGPSALIRDFTEASSVLMADTAPRLSSLNSLAELIPSSYSFQIYSVSSSSFCCSFSI